MNCITDAQPTHLCQVTVSQLEYQASAVQQSPVTYQATEPTPQCHSWFLLQPQVRDPVYQHLTLRSSLYLTKDQLLVSIFEQTHKKGPYSISVCGSSNAYVQSPI